MSIFSTKIVILGRNTHKCTKISKIIKNILVKTLLFPLKCQFLMIKYPYGFKTLSTDPKKYPYKCWQLDTGMPLFFSKIQYLPLYTIPLYTIMRVVLISMKIVQTRAIILLNMVR